MIKIRKYFPGLLLLTSLYLITGSCSHPKTTEVKNNSAGQPLPVIFETDIGNDVDDALALAMLHNYMNAGKVHLLAVMYNKDNKFSGEYIDIVDTWYGHGDIPIGRVIHGKTPEDPSFTRVVSEMQENGKPVFKRSLQNYDTLPNAVLLYRKILSQAKDSSVVIISVGFSTNLARLLQSEGDQFSPLKGRELVAQKVKLLSVMAGCFDNSIQKEYNIRNDVRAAYTVFADWPGPVVVSPYEVGTSILYPAVSIENDFNATRYHPVAEAYKAYLKMPYDRPCWDLTSVLEVVEPEAGWFIVSPPGTISVDTLTAKTIFTPTPGGEHCYLQVDSVRALKIRDRLVEVVTGKDVEDKKSF